jgi:uncharacterized protein YaiL (DUF2058 family)
MFSPSPHHEYLRFMSTSLRDQLLKVGLINEKQAREADRQLQRHQQRPQQQLPQQQLPQQQLPQRQRPQQQLPQQQRPQQQRPLQQRPQQQGRQPAPEPNGADQASLAARQQKAEKKAKLAEIKQLIEQNRLPKIESEEYYNFVDGNKIRRIAADASIRDRLSRGELAIVRHEGRFDLVPAAVAARIRERHERAVIAGHLAKPSYAADEAYAGYSVPDDLIW